MNGSNLGADFTLVKTAPTVTLPCMTDDSDTCRAQFSTKFLLLLATTVLAGALHLPHQQARPGLCYKKLGYVTNSLMLYCPALSHEP